MGAITDAYRRIFRDYSTDGVAASGAHEPVKSDIRAIGELIESAIGVGFGNVTVVKTTKALLDADLAHAANTVALVYADANFANNDIYVKTGASGAGAWTNTGALNAAFLGQLRTEREKQPSPFLPTVANEYLRRVVTRASIERGVPGRAYVVRHRTDIVGVTHRVRFYLYDPVLEVVVAQASVDETGDWPAYDTLFLCNVAAGSPIGGAAYVGVSATFWINRDAYENGQIDEAVTSPADAGIDPRNVKSREEVRDELRNGRAQNKLFVNADGSADFLNVEDAIESLMIDPMAPRSAYPFSHTCTPSNQWEIEIVGNAPHVWERIERVVDHGGGTMIGVGLILWEGLTLRLRHNTRLHTTGSATYGAPLFEGSFGGRIIAPLGARLEQLGYGYIGHIDAGNGISIPATVGPPAPTWQLVFTIDGGTIYGGPAQSGALIGRGASDGEDVLFCNGRTERDAANPSVEGHYFEHSSPGSLFGGLVTFENWSANDDVTPGAAIVLSKTHAQAVRHGLITRNCDIAKITEGHTSGDPGWVRLGPLPAGVALTGDLDP